MRVKTPSLLQMEAVECGAAALGIVLRYYGYYAPLEELRIRCGVSRDGSNALNLIRAAESYGLVAKGLRRSTLEGLMRLELPVILHWGGNHFVVLEGFHRDFAYINDPATGPRRLPLPEFERAYSGVVITCAPGEGFERRGQPFNILTALLARLRGAEIGLLYAVVAGLFLLIPGFMLPAFLRVFVDEILITGRDWMGALLAGMGLALLLRAGLTWLQAQALLALETHLAVRESGRFFWHTLHLPVAFFTQRAAGDIAERVGLNDRVAGLLSGQLAVTLIDVLLIAVYGALMLSYDILLTGIGLAYAVINLGVLQYTERRRTDANQQLLQARARLVSTSMDGLRAVETLKAAGTEDDFFARWTGQHAQVIALEQRLGYLTLMLAALSPFLLAVNTALLLTIGAAKVLDGQLTPGMLVAFQSLMFSFTAPINQLVGLGGQVQEVRGDITRLDDVLNYPAQTPPQTPPTVTDASGCLMIRDLSFNYNPLAPPFIQEFKLVILPGDAAALVGASGSGKSTVARLVAGLYEPWSGQILLDGEPLHPSRMAMVDQSISLFSGTFRDNLTLWDAHIPEADILAAARDACIHEVIMGRGGYEAVIQENGRDLSGGQRQCLEIARALVRNPALLILDEATSALDETTERRLMRNLRARGCTLLIIAHRLSSVRECETIIVMENGRIVQRGGHHDLSHETGAYADLHAG